LIAKQEKATQGITSIESQEPATSQHSVNFSFSLQILAHEGLSVKGDASMQKNTPIPQRASRVQQPTTDVAEEYDDQLFDAPRSAIRWTALDAQPKPRTTGPIAEAPQSNRVTGSTRVGLYILLVLCLAFLFSGIVLPAISTVSNQLKYGDARIASYDLDGHSFITEETGGKVRIVVSSADNQHTQVLTTVVAGVKDHALVSLSQDGNTIDVFVNATSIARLVPDGKGGYAWGSN